MSGTDASTVTSRAPDALTVEARTPTEITDMTAPVTVADKYSSLLFTYTTTANQAAVLSVKVEDNPAAQPAFALLPESGKFEDLIVYARRHELPAAAGMQKYFLVYWDQSGEAGYDITVRASPPPAPDPGEPANDDPTGATQLPNGATLERTILPADDVDYYVVAMLAGQTVTATLSHGVTNMCASFTGGEIDSVIEILDTDGMTSLANNDDISDDNWCSRATATVPANGTYYVRAAASPAFCAGCTFDYSISVAVQ
jgi:hypothetical protein